MRISSRGRAAQFELSTLLTEMGIVHTTEHKLPATSPRSKSGFFYADVAVFIGKRPIALVECKQRARDLRGRQRENYDGSGLPYRVAGMDNVLDVADWLRHTVFEAERHHG